MMIVAAKTNQEAYPRCGMKTNTSTRNARMDTSTVGTVSRKSAKRKRGECEGERKCAATARLKHTKQRKAAMG
jgi:hypothetical protein